MFGRIVEHNSKYSLTPIRILYVYSEQHMSNLFPSQSLPKGSVSQFPISMILNPRCCSCHRRSAFKLKTARTPLGSSFVRIVLPRQTEHRSQYSVSVDPNKNSIFGTQSYYFDHSWNKYSRHLTLKSSPRIPLQWCSGNRPIRT